jgi:hypothetical protein
VLPLPTRISTVRFPRHRPLLALLLTLAIGTVSPTAWAQYTWKDSRGQVHASDLPPPREVPEKDILKRPGPAARRTAAQAASAPASAASANSRAPQDGELEARRKKAEQEAQAKAQADEARLASQRADNCQRARQQIAMLESGQRMQRINERGERVVVDDAMRAAEIDTARRVADADCR